jgi:hypothetical protein
MAACPQDIVFCWVVVGCDGTCPHILWLDRPINPEERAADGNKALSWDGYWIIVEMKDL